MTDPDQNEVASDDSSDSTSPKTGESPAAKRTSPMGILIPAKKRSRPSGASKGLNLPAPATSQEEPASRQEDREQRRKSLSARLKSLSKKKPDTDKKPQKSTLLMFDEGQHESGGLAEDTETEDSQVLEIDAADIEEVEEISAEEIEESEEPTKMIEVSGLEGDKHEDFEGEKTELAPGLADAHLEEEFNVEKTELAPGLFDPPQVEGLSVDTDPEPDAQPNPQPEGLRSSHSLLSSPPNQGANVARTPETPPPRQNPSAEAQPEEEDFEVEKTELFQSPFENDPICPRLTTLEGPTAGQEFLINRLRSSVGRGTNNVISIPDLAMSRQHFEIVQNPDESYLVRDMRAVNGTELNGVKILESDLFHGDRVKAGETVFQFLIPGDVPAENRHRRLIPAASTQTASGHLNPAFSASPDNRVAPHSADRILLIVIITVALLCIPLSAYLFYTLILADDPVATDTASASNYYFEGAAALQSRDWDQAQAFFEKSYQTDPEFGEVEAQLARIERERRAKHSVERARQRAGDQIDEDTLHELSIIATESAYYEDAQSLLRLAGHDEAYAILSLAQDQFDEGDFDASAQSLDQLQAISPHHEGAHQLRTAIEEARAHQEEEAEEIAREAERQQRPRPSASSTRRRPQRVVAQDPGDGLRDPFAQPRSESSSSERGGSAVVNFTEGFTLYRARQFDEAIAHFDAINQASSGAIGTRANDASQDIKSFRDSLRAGENALSAGNFDAARNHFQAAKRADESVAGGTGYFDDTIAELLAASFARQGLQEVDSANFPRAFDLLTQAQAYRPREASTRQLSAALEEEANSLYIRAANQRKSDPAAAASLCNTILRMVPSSSDIHRRARQMLDEIDQ